MAFVKYTLKDAGLSFDDYNKKAPYGMFRMPAWFSYQYNRAQPGTLSVFQFPTYLDGYNGGDTGAYAELSIDALSPRYETNSDDTKLRLARNQFNKLANACYEMIREQGNPKVGTVIDILWNTTIVNSTDGQTYRAISVRGENDIAKTLRTAIYSQIAYWINNNPAEIKSSSQFQSGSGFSYSVDASTWITKWDQFCVDTKEVIMKSVYYNPPSDLKLDWFWRTQNELNGATPLPYLKAVVNGANALFTIESFDNRDPIALKSYVDAHAGSATPVTTDVDDTLIADLESVYTIP